MYLESLDSFVQQAEALFQANPLKTRYVMKYRHCDGKLVLKVTDDDTCLQYKTDQQADLKKVEKLNNLFFVLMATGRAPTGDVEMQPAAALPPAARQQQGKGSRRKG